MGMNDCESLPCGQLGLNACLFTSSTKRDLFLYPFWSHFCLDYFVTAIYSVFWIFSLVMQSGNKVLSLSFQTSCHEWEVQKVLLYLIWPSASVDDHLLVFVSAGFKPKQESLFRLFCKCSLCKNCLEGGSKSRQLRNGKNENKARMICETIDAFSWWKSICRGWYSVYLWSWY